MICGMHVMASVQDLGKCSVSKGTSTLFFALAIEHSIFSIMDELIVEMFFMLFSIYITVKMSEYKAP